MTIVLVHVLRIVSNSSEGAEEAVLLQNGDLVDSSAGVCHCEVSITVSNGPMQVAERHHALKKTSLRLCPRRGGFEPRAHAFRNSDNAF